LQSSVAKIIEVITQNATRPERRTLNTESTIKTNLERIKKFQI